HDGRPTRRGQDVRAGPRHGGEQQGSARARSARVPCLCGCEMNTESPQGTQRLMSTFVSFVCCVVMVLSAAPARAELVFFASGRSMSVKGHQIDGDTLVLTLRSGGQVICERTAIARIEPGEVPYPEPEVER